MTEHGASDLLASSVRLELQSILLQDRGVHDCVVLPRGDGLVVYLVPSGQLPDDATYERLRSRLSPAALGAAFVPVSRIPRNHLGEPDEPLLRSLPVIDDEVLGRWRSALSSLPGISRAHVVKRPRKEELGRLHIGSLITDENGSSGTPSLGRPVPSYESRDQPRAPRSAISHGGPLPEEAGRPRVLGEILRRAANDYPGAGVTYVLENNREISQSYPELLEEARRILGGLREAGVRAGDKLLLQLENNRDFLPAFWAAVLGGAIPVPVSIAPSYTDANATAQKLVNAWRLLGRPVILTSKALEAPLRELGRELRLDGFRTLPLDSLRSAPPASPSSAAPDDLALLLLTSGSTGIPKAVMHTHRTILSRPPATALVNGFSSADVSLNWMPLDHVVGLVMFHLRDVYLSCRQIHAPTALVLQNPLKWLDWMERYRVTVTWAPNFAYALVNERAAEIATRVWDLSSVKCVLNGAEAIVSRTARRYMELLIPHGLPPNAMRPGWGMSETSSGVCFSHRFSLGTTNDDDPFVELGTPIPGVSIRFVDEDNRLVDEGIVGRLQVRGPTVTPGYYQNPELNREVFTADGWFATGDLGFMREGRLTLTGREKAEIIINGVNYIGPEIEAVVEEVHGVAASFTAACGVRPRGWNTDALVVFFHTRAVEPERRREVFLAVQKRVAESIGIAPAFLVPLEKSEIPKTETGKIQRLQLKNLFEAGAFDDRVREADLLTANARTIPNWFYRRVWRPRVLARASRMEGGVRTLVLTDGTKLGKAVLEKIALSAPVVGLEPAGDFARLSKGRIRLNVDEESDFRLAVQAAVDELGGIDRILFLQSSPSESGTGGGPLGRGASRGAARVLWLIRALYHAQGESLVRFVCITREAQRVSGEESIDGELSPLLSIATTLPQELPWLPTTLVDLERDCEPSDRAAEKIVDELRARPAEPEVAYRSGMRFVSRLETVKLEPAEGRKPPLRRGGFYVVSGGLGGVGVELARELLTRFEVKLLLLGRTRLLEERPAVSPDDRPARLAESLRELEALAGEVVYEAADVSDEGAVELAVGRARARWGRLDGVFHLAGAYHERNLLDESEPSLESLMQAKVGGALVLHRLIQDDPDAIFVGFSSLGAYFGAAGVGGYSAANRFLSDLCRELDRRGAAKCYVFDWSVWSGLGLSSRHAVAGLDRLRGYLFLSRDEAMRSLHGALAADERALLVGLDGSHEFVRNRSEGPVYPLTALTGYYVSGEPASLELEQLKVADRFGTPTTCELVARAELPLLPSGDIDLRALGAEGGRDAVGRSREPSETERLIEGFWREVLEVPRVDFDDDFFALGGDSILATQLLARLRSAFGGELTLHTVFENPTVRQLAARMTAAGATEERLAPIERDDAQGLLGRIQEISDDEVRDELARLLRDEEKER